MKIIVIGAGMSGCAAAITLKRNNHDVTLLDQNNRIGKKISATGNGRCNISNCNITAEFYNQSPLVTRLLHDSSDKVNEFIDSVGLVLCPPDKEGRLYPITDNANSVVDCLRNTIEKLNIDLVLGVTVKSIKKSEGKLNVITADKTYIADKVVVSVGSKIANNNYNTALIDGKYLTATAPSLTPLRIVNADKTLNNIKVKATATLKSNGEILKVEQGEILFKEYGVSGIAVFNLSAIIARDLVKGVKHNYLISLDLMPNYDLGELNQMLTNRLAKFGNGEEFFYGLLNNKLAQSFMKKLDLTVINGKSIKKLAQLLKNYELTVAGLTDATMAQVICGGVDEKYLSDSLEIDHGGVYATGELLNVDGVCGGYNLHMAILTGLTVGQAI